MAKYLRASMILGVAAMLAGCGGGGGSSSSSSEPAPSSSASTSSSATTPSSSSSVAPREVNISFWTAFGQTPLEAAQKAAKDFSKIIKEQTGDIVNIDITYGGGYDEIRTKIEQGFAVGNIPTMSIAYPDHVANYLGQSKNYVYNIQPFMDDPDIGFCTQPYLGDSDLYDADDFVEAYLDEGRHYKYEGTYSMPLMKSSEILFYNYDAMLLAIAAMPDNFLPDAPRSSPEDFLAAIDWDEFMQLCQFIKDHKNQILDTLEVPCQYDSDGNFFVSEMFQNNIPYGSIGPDGVGRIDFESGDARANTEKMVNKLKGYVDAGLLTTKGVTGQYGSYDFAACKSVFVIGSSGGAGYNEPAGDIFKPAVARVPAFNKANPLYVTQGPTMTFLRNPTLSDEVNDLRASYAWQFAKYITNPAVNVYLCVWGSEGYVPVRYSAYEDSKYQSFLSQGEFTAQSAQVLINEIDGKFISSDVFVGSAELRDKVGGVLTQVFSGDKDTTTAITDMILYVKTFLK